MNNSTHIHILGICGRATAGIAVLLKNQGYHVTGSDQGAYAPMTEYLNNNQISFFDNYAPEHITPDIDLVLVGGNTLHIDPQNPEFLRAKELQIETKSWAQLAGEIIAKPESIVVTGTYGKTTITALLAHIFIQAGKDPSYLIGDKAKNFPNNIHIGNSQISIMEGDEHPTMGIDNQPKFLHYKPKYAVITSTVWDHFNIYKTQNEYLHTYKALINQIPQEGFIIANANHPKLVDLAQESGKQVYWYGSPGSNNSRPVPNAPFHASNIQFTTTGSTFTFHAPDETFEVNLPILGSHNIHNALPAIALSRLFQIPVPDIQRAISSFQGISGRLELLHSSANLYIYKDIGQHPQKARGAVEALREHNPDSHITVILDTHASVLHEKASLVFYPDAFTKADQVLILPIKHRSEATERVTGGDIVRAIKPDVSEVQYCPTEEKVVELLSENKNSDRIYLFLSTRDMRELINKVI